jgi:hypothetical protein
MHAEGADGLQRGGVVVGEVGDETFGEETRAFFLSETPP